MGIGELEIREDGENDKEMNVLVIYWGRLFSKRILASQAHGRTKRDNGLDRTRTKPSSSSSWGCETLNTTSCRPPWRVCLDTHAGGLLSEVGPREDWWKGRGLLKETRVR